MKKDKAFSHSQKWRRTIIYLWQSEWKEGISYILSSFFDFLCLFSHLSSSLIHNSISSSCHVGSHTGCREGKEKSVTKPSHDIWFLSFQLLLHLPRFHQRQGEVLSLNSVLAFLFRLPFVWVSLYLSPSSSFPCFCFPCSFQFWSLQFLYKSEGKVRIRSSRLSTHRPKMSASLGTFPFSPLVSVLVKFHSQETFTQLKWVG